MFHCICWYAFGSTSSSFKDTHKLLVSHPKKVGEPDSL